MVGIGVLAFQGSVEEHIKMLSSIEGVNPVEVKTAEQLRNVLGLILPGGESTTIGKLLKDYKMSEPIIKMAQKGIPVWGTCAGMILMAKEIANEEYVHLGIMDISVKRNAFGGQLESFNTSASIPQIAENDIPMVFIRAPWVERVWGDAEVLARNGEKTTAVRQRNMLATSFHPELTRDLSFHRFFVQMVKQWAV